MECEVSEVVGRGVLFLGKEEGRSGGVEEVEVRGESEVWVDEEGEGVVWVGLG